jgi:hypothetical protein
MTAGEWILLILGVVLWIVAFYFIVPSLIHHLLWLRWQRRHRHTEPIRHLGKTRLGR